MNKDKKEQKEEIKDLTLARLEVLPPDISMSVGSEGQFTRDELIKQVKNDTEIGKKMIEIELTYLRKLKERILYGEYASSH